MVNPVPRDMMNGGVPAIQFAGVQQRMKQNGKIKIYQDVLAQLEEAEPAAEPILPGGLTFPK